MTGGVTQRWRLRRDSYRPAGEPIATRHYEVATIADDSTTKAFVEQHHYSGSYPAARFRFGLYHHAELVGVAVFSHPCSDKVLTSVFPVPPREAAELGRFVLLDQVPANGETWFLARAFELLRQDLVGIVSFSDPIPRKTARGQVVFPGHLGTIYQAHNAAYLGRGTARTLRLLPDGRVFSARAAQKVRKAERGWKYSAQMLIEARAPPVEGDPALWLRTWLPRLTRTMRHPGNHRYAWPLDRALRGRLPTARPYPKRQPELKLTSAAA
jgi:hypothetical protein